MKTKLCVVVFILIALVSISAADNSFFALSLSYGPETHVEANAASDPGGNEADATTGWSAASSAVLSSQEATVSVGGSALLIESNTTPTANARAINQVAFAAVAGQYYIFTFSARHVGTGGAWNIGISSGQTIQCDLGFITLTSANTSFVSYVVFGKVIDANAIIEAIEASGTNDGGVYIDNASIRRVY